MYSFPEVLYKTTYHPQPRFSHYTEVAFIGDVLCTKNGLVFILQLAVECGVNTVEPLISLGLHVR